MTTMDRFGSIHSFFPQIWFKDFDESSYGLLLLMGRYVCVGYYLYLFEFILINSVTFP